MDVAQKLANLKRKSMQHISINIGYKCNQFCNHCHLEAGPHRNELMDLPTMHRLTAFIEKTGPKSIEVTGGAPEYFPGLLVLLSRARQVVEKISLRTNLTLLHLPSFSHILDYLKGADIELVASLPCYCKEATDRQRGQQVFEKSINNLQLLNAIGYGIKEGKILSLVYNPTDISLPPPQPCLEKTFKNKLKEMNIRFNQLYAMANVALGRFQKELTAKGQYKKYMDLLGQSFNPDNISGLMCLNQLTVDWKGNIYDCDFNLAAGLPRQGFSNIHNTDPKFFIDKKIYTGNHCLACTAGSGSSCHGALH